MEGKKGNTLEKGRKGEALAGEFLKREGLYKGPRRIEISKENIEIIIGRYLLGETAEEIHKDFSDKFILSRM